MIAKVIQKLNKIMGRFRRRDRIFLLSHMRANTSLFGHLLASNREIEGYYELHESYTKPEDFKRAQIKYYRSHAPKNGARYLFDKILHGNHEFDTSLLGPRDKVIFMIREPSATVASILKISSENPGSRWSTREAAENYYKERLEELSKLSQELKQRYLYLPSEALVGDSEASLKRLTEFLELNAPLTERYRTFEKTGKWGFGDGSSDISKGKIVTEKVEQKPKVDVDNTCRQAYEKTLEILKKNEK